MSWLAHHWQDLAAGAILLVACFYLGRRIYRSIARPAATGCEACSAHRLRTAENERKR